MNDGRIPTWSSGDFGTAAELRRREAQDEHEIVDEGHTTTHAELDEIMSWRPETPNRWAVPPFGIEDEPSRWELAHARRYYLNDVVTPEPSLTRSLTEPDERDTDRLWVRPPEPEPVGGRRWFVAAGVLLVSGVVLALLTLTPGLWIVATVILVTTGGICGMVGTALDHRRAR